MLGLTNEEIAECLDVSLNTFYEWKQDHEEFSESLKAGKEIADSEVVKSLYKRANGFEKDDKYFPPDPTSMIFWLKNRRRNQWRDKHELEHTGAGGESLKADPMEIARSVAFILNQAQVK